MNEVLQFLIALGVPSFIMGLGLFIIQRRLGISEKKREKEENARAKREEEKEKHEILMLRCILASIELGEVTARAVKGEKTNGDLDKALEHACKLKRDHRDFLQEKGVHHLI